MMLASTDGRIIADTRRTDTAGQVFPFPWLIEAAEREGKGKGAGKVLPGLDRPPQEVVAQSGVLGTFW